MRDFLIMDCLFLVISNDKTREELLSTHDLTLEGSSPVIHCARTLPESRKQVVRVELQRLVDAGIIVPEDEPTDWVSQMCAAEKKTRIRICMAQDLFMKH